MRHRFKETEIAPKTRNNDRSNFLRQIISRETLFKIKLTSASKFGVIPPRNNPRLRDVNAHESKETVDPTFLAKVS